MSCWTDDYPFCSSLGAEMNIFRTFSGLMRPSTPVRTCTCVLATPRLVLVECSSATEPCPTMQVEVARKEQERQAKEKARLEREAVAAAKEAELAAAREAERLQKEEAAAAAKKDIKRQRDMMRNAKRRLRKLCEGNAAMRACESDELRGDGPEVCGNGLELDVLNALIASIEEAPADAVCSSFGNLQSRGGDARAGGAERE